MNRTFCFLSLLLIACYGLAFADWGRPFSEQLPFGSGGFDLQKEALAVDGDGALHLIWRVARTDTAGTWLLYSMKSLSGVWQPPDTISPPEEPFVNQGVIAVLPGTSEPVIAYTTSCCLFLARPLGDGWMSYLVADGPLNGNGITICTDAHDNVHLSWVISTGFETYGLVYCAVTGTDPRPVDLLEGADLGGFGFGASPSIAADENGKSIIAYRGGDYPNYRIHFAGNDGLADTNWVYDQFTTGNAADYTPSIQYREGLGLYLSISGDDGWGMPSHVYTTWHAEQGGDWLPTELVSGAFSTNAAVIGVTGDGGVQFVSQEVSGNIYTGVALATEYDGMTWQTNGILESVESPLSFVIDPRNYGHLVCAAWNDAQELALVHVWSEIPLGGEFAAIQFEPDTLRMMAPGPGLPVDGSVTVRNIGNVTVELLSNDLEGPFRSFWDWPQVIEPGQTRELPVQFEAPEANVYYDSILVSGTPGVEAWLPCYGEVSFGAEVPPLVPREFSVVAYPNPFNPATRIAMDLPSATHVNVLVFDRLGRQVATLVNANLAAGSHRLTFDGTDLASGLYFLRVNAGAESRVIKAMLVR